MDYERKCSVCESIIDMTINAYERGTCLCIEEYGVLGRYSVVHEGEKTIFDTHWEAEKFIESLETTSYA